MFDFSEDMNIFKDIMNLAIIWSSKINCIENLTNFQLETIKGA